MDKPTQEKPSPMETLKATAEGLLAHLPTFKREPGEIPAPANGQGLLSLVVSKVALAGMNIGDCISYGIRTAREQYDEKGIDNPEKYLDDQAKEK